ncbi:MAG: M28 family peptidase [Cyanobacteria bacterium J06581_3]
MGKRGGFFLAIAAVIMTVIIWGNPINAIKSAFLPEIPVIVTNFQPSQGVSLTVEEARMMAHVRAVAQPRSTPAQKAVTRSYITQQLQSYGLAPEEQPYRHPETQSAETGGVNIVVELPGSDPAAGTIVLGAHYDGPGDSPGADDNGSAIAALLEAARLFSGLSAVDSTASLPLPATLKLVFFDQEEQQPDGTGLLGSIAFTQRADNVNNVKGAIILDMIGYACRMEGCQGYPKGLPLQNVPSTGDFLAVLGLTDYTQLIGAFMGSAKTTWPQVLSLPIPKPTLKMFPDLLRSDHASFWEKNIPAVFVTDTANFRNANYHTVTDTPDTLDPSFLRGNAQHIVNALLTLLSQDA